MVKYPSGNIAEARMLADVGNAVDAMLFECLVDIPQALGHEPNSTHETVIEFIIDRIKNNHTQYITEEGDE